MALVAVGFAVIACIEVAHFEPPPEHQWIDVVLAAVVTVPLAVAHRWAVPVFGVVVAGAAERIVGNLDPMQEIGDGGGIYIRRCAGILDRAGLEAEHCPAPRASRAVPTSRACGE